jgi:DnaK suppressor protein
VDNKKRLANKQRSKKQPPAAKPPAPRETARTRDMKPREDKGTMARKEALTSMREILVMRRDALRRALAGDLSTLTELREQTAGDAIDQALDSAHQELNSQLAEVESRELANIENALERMRIGEYGNCEGCGNKIPFARLSALPYATLCIECQREAERDGTAPGMEFMDWGRLVDGGATEDLPSINDLEIDVS